MGSRHEIHSMSTPNSRVNLSELTCSPSWIPEIRLDEPEARRQLEELRTRRQQVERMHLAGGPHGQAYSCLQARLQRQGAVAEQRNAEMKQQLARLQVSSRTWTTSSSTIAHKTEFLVARHKYLDCVQHKAVVYLHDYQQHVLRRLEAETMAQAAEMERAMSVRQALAEHQRLQTTAAAAAAWMHARSAQQQAPAAPVSNHLSYLANTPPLASLLDPSMKVDVAASLDQAAAHQAHTIVPDVMHPPAIHNAWQQVLLPDGRLAFIPPSQPQAQQAWWEGSQQQPWQLASFAAPHMGWHTGPWPGQGQGQGQGLPPDPDPVTHVAPQSADSLPSPTHVEQETARCDTGGHTSRVLHPEPSKSKHGTEGCRDVGSMVHVDPASRGGCATSEGGHAGMADSSSGIWTRHAAGFSEPSPGAHMRQRVTEDDTSSPVSIGSTIMGVTNMNIRKTDSPRLMSRPLSPLQIPGSDFREQALVEVPPTAETQPAPDMSAWEAQPPLSLSTPVSPSMPASPSTLLFSPSPSDSPVRRMLASSLSTANTSMGDAPDEVLRASSAPGAMSMSMSMVMASTYMVTADSQHQEPPILVVLGNALPETAAAARVRYMQQDSLGRSQGSDIAAVLSVLNSTPQEVVGLGSLTSSSHGNSDCPVHMAADTAGSTRSLMHYSLDLPSVRRLEENMQPGEAHAPTVSKARHQRAFSVAAPPSPEEHAAPEPLGKMGPGGLESVVEEEATDLSGVGLPDTLTLSSSLESRNTATTQETGDIMKLEGEASLDSLPDRTSMGFRTMEPAPDGVADELDRAAQRLQRVHEGREVTGGNPRSSFAGSGMLGSLIVDLDNNEDQEESPRTASTIISPSSLVSGRGMGGGGMFFIPHRGSGSGAGIGQSSMHRSSMLQNHKWQIPRPDLDDSNDFSLPSLEPGGASRRTSNTGNSPRVIVTSNSLPATTRHRPRSAAPRSLSSVAMLEPKGLLGPSPGSTCLVIEHSSEFDGATGSRHGAHSAMGSEPSIDMDSFNGKATGSSTSSVGPGQLSLGRSTTASSRHIVRKVMQADKEDTAFGSTTSESEDSEGSDNAYAIRPLGAPAARPVTRGRDGESLAPVREPAHRTGESGSGSTWELGGSGIARIPAGGTSGIGRTVEPKPSEPRQNHGSFITNIFKSRKN